MKLCGISKLCCKNYYLFFGGRGGHMANDCLLIQSVMAGVFFFLFQPFLVSQFVNVGKFCAAFFPCFLNQVRYQTQDLCILLIFC